MNELLRSDLFKVIAAVVVVGFVGRLLWPLLFRPKTGAMQERVVCSSCGWKGTIGKYNRKCSRCASTALEPVRK